MTRKIYNRRTVEDWYNKMINDLQLAVSIPGFTRQRVEVIPPGFFKGIQLLVNGKPVPRGARRGEYRLTDDKGQAVILKFRSQAFGLDYPQILVGGKFIDIVPPLKWYWWALAAIPLLLVTFGGGLGGLIGLIAVWINVRLIRQPWHWLARVGATLVVTLLSVVIWFLIILQLAQF
jgi:hypothetical protein